MITSVQIHGYRGFDNFELNGLGRINLLVGPNNGGKTSVLEAIYILMAEGDPAALWNVLERRGEMVTTENSGSVIPRREADVRHLFRGHEFVGSGRFKIEAGGRSESRYLSANVATMPPEKRSELRKLGDAEAAAVGLGLGLNVDLLNAIYWLPLSRSGGIREESRGSNGASGRKNQVLIPAGSLTTDELVRIWDRVQLTEQEILVLQALRLVDPNIERISARLGSVKGIIVKIKDLDQPVPIGSLGDGMWRILALAVALMQSRGGVLLVDEIDTGLHHSVMSEMWQFVFKTAKEFDVQVFATTHSYDCVYSLAHICAEADDKNPITVQRIEPGKTKAIPYAQDEIRIAADREIEVR